MALEERLKFAREAAHRFDATRVVPGGLDIRTVAYHVPSGSGQMVASLTAPPSSEVIRSLKLFQGHDGASGTEGVATMSI